MKTRLIAAIVAVVMAAVGAVVLVMYVRGADSRAMSGLDTVKVLIASGPIPKDTKAADLRVMVTTKELPASAALPGAVTNLDELSGEVALEPLVKGEQLLNTKFGQPPAVSSDELVIPPEMQ